MCRVHRFDPWLEKTHPTCHMAVEWKQNNIAGRGSGQKEGLHQPDPGRRGPTQPSEQEGLEGQFTRDGQVCRVGDHSAGPSSHSVPVGSEAADHHLVPLPSSL